MSADAVRADTSHARTGLYVKGQRGRKLRDQSTRRLVGWMLATMPWLEPSDRPACHAWAQMEMLADQAYAELRDRGVLNADGEPRRLFGDYVKLRRAQLPYSMALGMTPAGRIAIKAGATDAALDLVTLMQDATEPEPESK